MNLSEERKGLKKLYWIPELCSLLVYCKDVKNVSLMLETK